MTPAPAGVPGVLLVDLARRQGGAEQRVLQLAELLPAAGVPVHVACLAGAPLHRSLERAGVPHTPLARSRLDPRIAPRLRGLLGRRRGWVVDAHNAQSQLWTHLSRPGRSRRLVATVHSEYDLSETRRAGWSVHERVLLTVKRAGWSFVAISTSVEDYLGRVGVPRERIWTAWSGVRPGLPESPQTRSDVRRSLGLSEDDFLVLSAGRLVPVKNLPLLLRAIARLRREVPQAYLVVAGDGVERARLERLAEDLGVSDHVRFLGHRSDVPVLMQAADVCAMTSTIEGLPYTLLEAAAAGTAVVSTAVGAIGSVFTHEESALLLVDPDEEDVAAALATLARVPAERQRMAVAAREVLMTRLSPEAMVDATLAAYTGTRGGPAPGRHDPRERVMSIAQTSDEEPT